MAHPTPLDADAAQCPRCGVANGCALASGNTIDHCWCRDVPFDMPLPATTPAHCYCARCLREMRTTQETPDAR